MFDYKKHCTDCEMCEGERREGFRPAHSGVTIPQTITEIAPFCMVADEFCDQLSKCPLRDI